MTFREMKERVGKVIISAELMDSPTISEFFEDMRDEGAIGLELKFDIYKDSYEWTFLAPFAERVAPGSEIPIYSVVIDRKFVNSYKLL